MQLELTIKSFTQYRCDNCGKIIKGNPLGVKTCCVNKPKVFCSLLCLKQFTSQWVRSQEAIKSCRTRSIV